MKLNHTSRVGVILIALFLATATARAISADPPKFPDAECGTLPKRFKEMATTAIKGSLLDADSAKIRFPDTPPVRGAIILNGNWAPGIYVNVLVNSKNAFGGYTGFHRFIVSFYKGKVCNVNDLSVLP